jgi:hypothetical protein
VPDRDRHNPRGPRDVRDTRDRQRAGHTEPGAATGRPADATSPHAPSAGARPSGSGRVQFDKRGRAIWEWSVGTGLFDRDASTARITALTDAPLEILTGAHAPRGGTPAPAGEHEPGVTDGVEPPTALPGESAGGDPYSSGPARSPEKVSFNPYVRGPTRKR